MIAHHPILVELASCPRSARDSNHGGKADHASEDYQHDAEIIAWEPSPLQAESLEPNLLSAHTWSSKCSLRQTFLSNRNFQPEDGLHRIFLGSFGFLFGAPHDVRRALRRAWHLPWPRALRISRFRSRARFWALTPTRISIFCSSRPTYVSLKQTFAAHLVEMPKGIENGQVSYTEVANLTLLLRNTRGHSPVPADVVALSDRLNRHQFVAKLTGLPLELSSSTSNM